VGGRQLRRVGPEIGRGIPGGDPERIVMNGDESQRGLVGAPLGANLIQLAFFAARSGPTFSFRAGGREKNPALRDGSIIR
jgi:hypothetical protein